MGDVEITKEELACLVHGEVANMTPGAEVAKGLDLPEPRTLPTSTWDSILPALTSIWQDFALRWSSLLTSRLRIDVQLEVASIEQQSYGDFIFGLDHPTCLQVISADGMVHPWLIEQHPATLFPILDRLLGGGSLPPTVLRRPLTEIESRLVHSVTNDMLLEMETVWSSAMPVRLAQRQMESNPKLVRAAHPGDPMFVTVMKVGVGESAGFMKIAISRASIAAASERLKALLPAADGRDESARAVAVAVSLATTHVNNPALMDLRVGDILTTDTRPDEPAILSADGCAKFRVTPGAHAGKKAVRVESVC